MTSMIQRPHVLFLSPMCLLDSRSGAALSVRTWLEVLAEKGYRCESLSMSAFDGAHEYPFAREVGRKAAAEENFGKFLQLERNGVRHIILYTRSTIGTKITQKEQNWFLNKAQAILEKTQPEIVISYGSSEYTKRLQDLARDRCKRFLFYLANATFRNADFFAPADLIICPSEFLADYYRKSLGLNPSVIRSVIDPGKTVPPDAGIRSHPQNRKTGFVTFINPQPDKGLTLFLRLVRMAGRECPWVTFLVVEGRVSRENLQKAGFDPGAESNVWWLSNQQDIRRVYARTCLLLFPSFWQEAAGRVISEAQMSGIPVLAANRGGIPEQLNSGGFLFDIPERCTYNYLNIPTEAEVRPWLDTIVHLMEDDAAYVEARAAAFAAGRIYDWERRTKAVVDFFESLLKPDEREFLEK